MTPADAATNTVSDEGNAATDDDNRGARQYTVSGLPAGEYDIVLFQAEDVTVDADGNVTFEDDDENATAGNNVADYVAPATGVEIEVVNGTSTGDNNGHVLDVTPVNGTINFTVDSTVTDEVIPVILVADTNSTDGTPDVDLDANDGPTEAFGVGGQKNWIPTEAAAGGDTAGVESVNRDADYFVGDTDGTADGATAEDRTYYYDANDTFQDDGTPITLAQFEALLTNADIVSLVYTQNEDLSSTFNVTTDAVPAPTNVKSTVSDLDGDGTADDATITWTASTQPDAIYNVYTGDCADGLETVDDTVVKENVSGTSTTINNAAGNTYCVGAEGGTSGDVSTNDPSVSPTTPAANVAPLAIDTVITTNSGFGNTFDAGDVFKVVFNEGMAAPTAGDTIRAEDNDGTKTVADFINGTNSTWTLNAAAETVNGVSRAAGTVITVTLTAAPTTVIAGTAAGLQIPATIIDQSGTADDDGAGWNVAAASQDLLIDQDANDDNANSADAAAPSMASAAGVDGGAGTDTVTVTYDENVRCNELDPGQFEYDADGAAGGDVAATAIDCDGDTTIVVTFPTGTFTAASGTDLVRYTESGTAANRVEDMSDNEATSPDSVAITG